jgi:hypothetical protein
MAEKNTVALTQSAEIVLLEIFPIETAQNNVKQYDIEKYIHKFANTMISRINNNISHHSKQGETNTQIVFSCLEIFRDYPVQDKGMLQAITDIIIQQYSSGGYEIYRSLIESEYGVKGVVFTIIWDEENDGLGDGANEI